MTTSDSDNDRELEPMPAAKWRQYEAEVAKIAAELDDSAVVQHNVTLPGLLSRTPRQVDVLITGQIVGEEFRIAVECKRYANPVGIGTVDEFAGKLLDLGLDRGVLMAANGLTAPAEKRAFGAAAPRITFGSLTRTPAMPESEIARLFTGLGDCPNGNCYTGDVVWHEWPNAFGEIRGGSCGTCGTWAAECPKCGEVVAFVNTTEECYCGTILSLDYERKGSEVEGITSTRPSFS